MDMSHISPPRGDMGEMGDESARIKMFSLCSAACRHATVHGNVHTDQDRIVSVRESMRTQVCGWMGCVREAGTKSQSLSPSRVSSA